MSLASASIYPTTSRKPTRASETLRWKCIYDPSGDGVFRDNLFTLAMIQAGGFDEGAEFQHVRTGEIRIWRGCKLIKHTPYEAFKKYKVQAASVEEFLAKYYRRDRYIGRGKEYAVALLASHQGDFDRDGFDIISSHDSVTGYTVAFYGAKA